MRRRILTAALAAALAVAGLAGCRTNVGIAARIDQQRITEKDINEYLTADAQAVKYQDQTTASPRTFAVTQLINARLYTLVFQQLPGGREALGKVDAEMVRELNGKTYRSQAEQLGVKGYSEKFDKIVMRNRLLGSGLQNLAQSGVDVRGAVGKIRIHVWVSPRYGTWDAKKLSLTNAPALPSFVTAQPVQGQPAG